MKLGSSAIYTLIFYSIFSVFVNAEDMITSTPLINVDEIKPSFEELEDENENVTSSQDIKEKKR